MAGAVCWLPAGDEVQEIIGKVIGEFYPGTFAEGEVVGVFRDDPKWKNAASFHPVPKWARILTVAPEEMEEARLDAKDRLTAALAELSAASDEARSKLSGDDAAPEESSGDDDEDDEQGPGLGICFVVELKLSHWVTLSADEKEALIDHELFHRVKREHDITEFAEVAARRPCLRADITRSIDVKAKQMAFSFGDEPPEASKVPEAVAAGGA